MNAGGYEFTRDKDENGYVLPRITYSYHTDAYSDETLFPENKLKDGSYSCFYVGYQYIIVLNDFYGIDLDNEVAKNNVDLFEKLLEDISSEKKFFHYGFNDLKGKKIKISDFKKFCEDMLKSENREKHIKRIKERIVFYNEKCLENINNKTNNLSLTEETKIKEEIAELKATLKEKEKKLIKKPSKTQLELEEEVDKKYPLMFQ